MKGIKRNLAHHVINQVLSMPLVRGQSSWSFFATADKRCPHCNKRHRGKHDYCSAVCKRSHRIVEEVL